MSWCDSVPTIDQLKPGNIHFLWSLQKENRKPGSMSGVPEDCPCFPQKVPLLPIVCSRCCAGSGLGMFLCLYVLFKVEQLPLEHGGDGND